MFYIEDPRLIAAVVAALATVLIWCLGRGYELFAERRHEEAVRRNFIRALYAEVDFNTTDMELFLSEPLTPTLERTIRENNSLIPHIVDARHTEFYRSNISALHHVSDRLIGRVVHFYGMIEKLASQIDALERPSFRSISPESRVKAVERIYQSVRDCHIAGMNLLADLAADDQKLALNRTDRNTALTAQEFGKSL